SARVVDGVGRRQRVALATGADGGAVRHVGILEFFRQIDAGALECGATLATLMALIIGGVSFSGSAVAFGKLQGIITPKAFRYSGQQLVTGGIAAATALLSLVVLAGAVAGSVPVEPMLLIAIITQLALALGVALVMPIGRSVRSICAEDWAILLGYAQNVIVVPGYGLAVAQAQHNVRELADLLESKGITVRYAIHPVAGRMPGHMNVLLAEANIPYDKLFDMEQINPEFPRADVALVIGANDVTNPAAR